MKFTKYILIVLLLPLASSFDSYELKDSRFLLQKWVQEDYDQNGFRYKSASSFESDKPGIEFLKDGSLIKRQNAGWCGTPPISYDNFDGKWERISDNEIKIEHRFWGGTSIANVRIVSLTETEMIVQFEQVETIMEE